MGVQLPKVTSLWQIKLSTNFSQADGVWKDTFMGWSAIKDMIVTYQKALGLGETFITVHKAANKAGFAVSQ